MAKTTSKKRKKVQWVHPWTKRQFILIGGGIGVIVIGFLLMATGINTTWDNPLAVSVAPMVLVLAYCVLIPLAIMFGNKKEA